MHTTRPSLHTFTLFCASIATLAILSVAAVPVSAAETETELLDILRSDAAGGEKAIACKKLAIHGSNTAVPELAKLLPNPHLSSWARIALEVIPGTEADEALRMATQTLDGRLLVGTINSIGVRQDAGAVEILGTRLQDSDPDVASAAAIALGRIGNEPATKLLQQALQIASGDVRSAVAEGYLLCAERLHGDDKSGAATEIYDQIRNAELPMQRIVEATRGAILSRHEDGIALLMETFRSDNKKLFQLALGTAREFPGGDVDHALAKELTRATPQRAALIVQAMADRTETVVLDAVLQAAQSGDKQVRVSAIDALKRVGDVSVLSPLLTIALDQDTELAQAAKDTLAELPGAGVDATIVAMLPDATGKSYPLLIDLVGSRRIDAVPDLVRALEHSDPAVRAAALIALGETVSLQKLPLLVEQVVAPKRSEDAAIARQALKAASVRMPDREACAAELASAIGRAPAETKTVLLEILSDVSGTTALQTLATSAKSSDPELQDTASRLLGKWNNLDAAPVLLDLSTTAPAEKYQVRALRGYIGLARKFSMPERNRAEMCKQALDVASRVDEQRLVLDVLKLHPSVAGLKLAIDAKQIPAVKDDATAAALEIAQQLRKKGVDVSRLKPGA
ncbi:HEAT repeat protein [Stieleria neptunia]|uniref:HEAT repeat protein n=1 Tax=Stieleria neptunia TaxID=2527979 RepID=A0A518HUT0_9BACT|nr:HEAT repeat domain-containing protein [Stieleria neptunia]QDV44600.1 HEAT repeat protein [Stieleria neptunia]